MRRRVWLTFFTQRQKELGPKAQCMWQALRIVVTVMIISFLGTLVLGTDFATIAGMGLFSWGLITSVVVLLPTYFLFQMAKRLD
jgi:hypothetical protein